MSRRLSICLACTLGTLALLSAGCSDAPVVGTSGGQDSGGQTQSDLYQPPATPPSQDPPAGDQDGAASTPPSTQDAGGQATADAGGGATTKDAAPAKTPPSGTAGPGAVCTSDAICKAGHICFFADTSKKGTCVLNNCKTNADCQTAAAKQSNYFSMCLTRQTWDVDKDGKKTNIKTFHHCGYFCAYSGKTYSCPPSHACKALSGYKTCVPK